jgi:hypothetical protein
MKLGWRREECSIIPCSKGQGAELEELRERVLRNTPIAGP